MPAWLDVANIANFEPRQTKGCKISISIISDFYGWFQLNFPLCFPSFCYTIWMFKNSWYRPKDLFWHVHGFLPPSVHTLQFNLFCRCFCINFLFCDRYFSLRLLVLFFQSCTAETRLAKKIILYFTENRTTSQETYFGRHNTEYSPREPISVLDCALGPISEGRFAKPTKRKGRVIK